MQTVKGPTSIRIATTICGKYKLDAELKDAYKLKDFDSPMDLIAHYIREGSTTLSTGNEVEVFVDHTKALFSKIVLTEPILKEPKSLSHLARLAINKHKIDSSKLPGPIQEYLEDYPYEI